MAALTKSKACWADEGGECRICTAEAHFEHSPSQFPITSFIIRNSIFDTSVLISKSSANNLEQTDERFAVTASG